MPKRKNNRYETSQIYISILKKKLKKIKMTFIAVLNAFLMLVSRLLHAFSYDRR